MEPSGLRISRGSIQYPRSESLAPLDLVVHNDDNESQEYDLSNIRILVHEWRDSANELVHMRDYGHKFTPGQKVYVTFKIHLYNIVEGTAKAPVTRPSWIGSAVVESIQLFPEDEVDLQMLYIELAKNLKDKEDRKKEELHEADLYSERASHARRRKTSKPKKTTVKGKSARALEKERAVEEGELVVEDVVADEDINMDPNV
ncbi:hypothetical protein EV360DRAFT_76671 [Lentinula raphanica]|nr:hypothetical protein EV360DRAFT_76671 [Lentinula raphanica]